MPAIVVVETTDGKVHKHEPGDKWGLGLPQVPFLQIVRESNVFSIADGAEPKPKSQLICTYPLANVTRWYELEGVIE